MGEWISTKDKLPKDDESVLTYNEDNDYWSPYEIGNYSSCSKEWTGGEMCFALFKVTHWMKLKAPDRT